MSRPQPEPRSAYPYFLPITTRWMDNDVYGHVNNVVYYSYFDTVVNRYLVERGVLDIHEGQTIGLVVETQCNYFSSIAFPQMVHAGLRVAQLGRSLDVDANTNGQVVIRDSAINEGFNTAKPWADAVISNRPFAGNTGNVDDNDEVQRNLNDTNYNRMWEYNNRGVGSKVVAEAKK